jgi:hypothetical protein
MCWQISLERNQAWDILQGKRNFKCETLFIKGMLRSIPDHSEEEWRERSKWMRIRNFFLAAIAVAVLFVSVVPANAAGHHHRHHHHKR